MLSQVSSTEKLSNLTTEIYDFENATREKIIEQFKHNWAVKDWMRGYFKEEDIYDINVHWMKFGPPNDYSFFILGVLYIIIMSIGVFGNCLVVFMFIRCKTLRTPANTLIVNLAISDALMMIKMPVFIYNCFYKGPILGDIGCRIYAFLGGLTGTVSIVTLAAISFDRYYVIKYPLNRTCSKIRINICLISSWMYGLSFSIIPLLNIGGLGKYQYEGYLTSCSFDYLTENKATRNFILIFFCAAWVIPFSLISFSYFKIIQVVGGRGFSTSGKRDSFRHVKEEDKRKQEIKLAVIVLMVIFLWFFSWTPYATVALLGIFRQKHLITPLGSMIPALFCKMASSIDPYVYAVSHPKFREELWKMLGLDKKKKKVKKNHKVWSTENKLECATKFGSRENSDDDVEEESVEIELKSIDFGECSSRKDIKIDEDMKNKVQQFQRQSSYASILCLKPSFSNKTSSIRRLSRKWSTYSRSKSQEEDEGAT